MFLSLLAISLFTDSIDGFVARKLNASSEFGAKLDSWGDLSTYLTVPLGAYWLWPEILEREAFFFLLAIAAFILPLIAAILKFKRLPSYHTWAAKTSAVLISAASFLLFITDIAWPFKVAAIVQAAAACEEIAITIRLTEIQTNVRSLWHVNRQYKYRIPRLLYVFFESHL